MVSISWSLVLVFLPLKFHVHWKMFDSSVASSATLLIPHNVVKDNETLGCSPLPCFSLQCCIYITNKICFPLPHLITGFLHVKPPDIGQFREILWDYTGLIKSLYIPWKLH